MSLVKRMLENLSEEMGLGGKINKRVMDRARRKAGEARKKMVQYKFKPGDRVEVEGQEGEVITCVPGNGIPWYFVRFDGEIEDRFTEDQLAAIG